MSNNIPCKQFTGKDAKLYNHLAESGQIRVVTKIGKIKAYWENKGYKAIMTDYSTYNSNNTNRVFNPKTCKITKRRDIKQLD